MTSEETLANETERASFYDNSTDLRSYWYPVFPSYEVTNKKPVGFYLLEDPVVMYRDEDGKAVALSDKCAHRSVPLSVGRIMDGKLECRYHGWQYDSKGQCLSIPSLVQGRKIPANARVRTYAVHEDKQWNWVWIHATKTQEEWDQEEATGPTFFLPWGPIDTPSRLNYVDLDIDHSLLVENFLDPSHIPFTHDSTIGRRSMAAPMKMGPLHYTPTSVVSTQENPTRPDLVATEFTFVAPITVGLKFLFPSKPELKMDQCFYCVPTKKGHSRFIYMQRFSFFKYFSYIPGLSVVMDWYLRRYTQKILMEDYAMLKGQQDRLKAGANAMNSPVAADTLIKAYRNWWRVAMKKNPWFKGYRCGTGSAVDIEDIIL